MLSLAVALLALSGATGIVGYVIGQRYVDARAGEMGLAPHKARSGLVNDAGSTEFEDRMNFEVFLGTYGGSKNVATLSLGRRARKWSLTSVALAVAAIIILAVQQYGHT